MTFCMKPGKRSLFLGPTGSPWKRRAATRILAVASATAATSRSGCYTYIGRCQRDRGDIAAAQESFQRSVEMAEKTRDAVLIAQAEGSLGSLLVFQEQYPKALEHYRKSLGLCHDAQLDRQSV